MCQRHEICTTKQETQAKTGNEIVPTLPTSKCEKKGWKMSGKVANGKVTVIEYSKSAKGFFEITGTNHSIWICLAKKHTCKQKYTSALFLHVNNVK